jgi:uncharacterized membrane protein YfcA
VFALVACGSSVQSSLGFGLGLIAAPLLLLIDARLVPGPLMAAGVLMTLLVAYRERAAIDFVGLRFALGGRIAGTLLAALIWTAISPRIFDLVFGGLVLFAVVISLTSLRISPGPRSAAAAGALSGFMATLSAIGGPPMALLYQRASPARLRGTLAGFYVIGALISLTALAFVGRYGSEELVLTLYLVPAILLGYWASRWLRDYLDVAGARPFLLGLSCLTALAVLYRALV